MTRQVDGEKGEAEGHGHRVPCVGVLGPAVKEHQFGWFGAPDEGADLAAGLHIDRDPGYGRRAVVRKAELLCIPWNSPNSSYSTRRTDEHSPTPAGSHVNSREFTKREQTTEPAPVHDHRCRDRRRGCRRWDRPGRPPKRGPRLFSTRWPPSRSLTHLPPRPCAPWAGRPSGCQVHGLSPGCPLAPTCCPASTTSLSS